jgi:hypothetical protein
MRRSRRFFGGLLIVLILSTAGLHTAFAATLSTLRPNGDGTQTNITFSTGTTANTLIDDDPDTPTTSDYIQQTRNTSGDDTSFILVSDMPSDFASMTTVDVKADVSNSSGGNDTVTLKAQIFQSDETTALTNELTLSTDTDASGLKSGTFSLQGNNDKTVWDGARIKFTWTYGRSAGADTNFVRLTATELNGTYAQITAPTVSTQAASSVGKTSATFNGTIDSTGGVNADERGFAWGTGSALSGGDTATSTASGSFAAGAFTDSSQTLLCNTTYYYRAYAHNTVGYGYGPISDPFTTTACAPTVTTQSASGVGQTSATLNGTITSTGGANATQRGFAWGTDENLSGGDTATTTDTAGQPFGTGAFTDSSLTFTCNTRYYSGRMQLILAARGSVQSPHPLQLPRVAKLRLCRGGR